MATHFKLPDGNVFSGYGWKLVGDMQYQLDQMSDAELASIGVEKIVVDERYYYVSETGEPVERPIEEVRKTLKDQVAADRWSQEQNGVNWKEHRAQTDRGSRTNYTGMVDAVDKGIRENDGVYKFIDGPFPLANAEVVGLADTVFQYVQGLYDQEAAVGVQIDALQTVEEAKVFTWSLAEPTALRVNPDELDMGPTIGVLLGGENNVKS